MNNFKNCFQKDLKTLVKLQLNLMHKSSKSFSLVSFKVLPIVEFNFVNLLSSLIENNAYTNTNPYHFQKSFLCLHHSELETKRTSSSLRLAEEKAILREIAQIQKAKVAYEESRVHEKLIQEKKVSTVAVTTSS